MKEKCLEKVSEAYIDALYYYEMYFSKACWQGDPNVVDEELKKITSDRGMKHAVKENINIRVIGFGWVQFKISWSKNGKVKSVCELAQHLKTILKAEQDGIKNKKPQSQHSSYPSN